MRPPVRSESGLTIIELMFVTVLMGMATYAISEFILGARHSAQRGGAAAELLQRDLRSVTNLRNGLQDCVELIANYGDSTADAMKGLHSLVSASVVASENPEPAISTAGAPAPVAFTGWPTVETESEVDMNGPSDPGSVAWGNELMYVAQLNPITFTAYYTYSAGTWSVGGSSSNTATDAEILSVGRLQFVYDYLAWDPGTSVAGSGAGLRMVEWRSQPFIDYDSLSGLTNTPGVYTDAKDSSCCPRLTAACQYLSLTSTGYTLAFAPSCATLTSNCSSCFYNLSYAAISAGAPTPAADLPMFSWAYLDDFDEVESFDSKPGVDLGRIARANGDSGGQTAGPGGYSVAFNTSGSASTQMTVVALQGQAGPLQVPAYAEANNAMADDLGGQGFPAGFEVSVGGQYDSREIFVRLVLMVSNGAATAPGVFQAQEESAEIAVDPLYDF